MIIIFLVFLTILCRVCHLVGICSAYFPLAFSLQDFESSPATLSFTKNGTDLGTAFTLDDGVQGQALFPHIATKNVVVTVKFSEV